MSELLGMKVLLATDGPEKAAQAAQATAEVTEGNGSELHIVHVLRTAPHIPYSPPATRSRIAFLEQAKRDAQAFLEGQAERIRSDGGSVAEICLRNAER